MVCGILAIRLPALPRGPIRFHDLSRRAKRVVGRSDAVLHRFEEAKPSRSGCIVVPPTNAFYMCEALPGFDSCWAASPKRNCEFRIKTTCYICSGHSRNGCIVVRSQTPSICAIMTYPDEQSESLEGQMQSYTIPRRRSLFGMDV